VIVAEKNQNQKIANQFDCFEVNETKQADFSLLRLSLEKNFDKKISHTAHEIRNPLSAMELHSKIISKRLDNLNEESITSIKSSLGCIINSIEVLKSITEGLKDFSQDIEIKSKKADISKTLANVAEIIRPTFEEKNVKLNLPKTQNVICEFDETKTHQIIYNLLKNALEASIEGDSTDVYFIRKNTEISILIKDSGCGIQEKNIEKIFYPNFTTKTTGCGIGLCESKQIAKAQKGDLTLISTGKKGSVFELRLPK
jgi:signal transduction histidine kinase